MEYDPLFSELERAAEIMPERQSGDSIIPAEEPDWRQVRNLAAALLEQTKDIRIAVNLARALVHTHGLMGIASGLSIISGLLEQYWACLHPQADPEDSYPILMMNMLGGLNDYSSYLKPVRAVPLTESRGLGRFSLNDIEISEGKTPPPEAQDDLPTTKLIDAAFKDTDIVVRKKNITALAQAIASINTIGTFLTDRVGVENAPDFSRLVPLLDKMSQIVRAHVVEDDPVSVDGEELAGISTVSTMGAVEGVAAGAVRVAQSAGIRSREDVERRIDEICEYYERYEPSSPTPLVLKRARRMVSMDFMEILRDLAPGGVGEAEVIFGKDEGEEKK